jgi:hypothetical protein
MIEVTHKKETLWEVDWELEAWAIDWRHGFIQLITTLKNTSHEMVFVMNEWLYVALKQMIWMNLKVSWRSSLHILHNGTPSRVAFMCALVCAHKNTSNNVITWLEVSISCNVAYVPIVLLLIQPIGQMVCISATTINYVLLETTRCLRFVFVVAHLTCWLSCTCETCCWFDLLVVMHLCAFYCQFNLLVVEHLCEDDTV